MQWILSAALAAAVALGAARVDAAPLPMFGGKVAKLKDKEGTSRDQALAKFTTVGAFITSPPPSPLCPAASSVRLHTESDDIVLNLDCAKWKQTGSGFVYQDPLSTTGVFKVVMIATPEKGKLLVKVRGDAYGAAAINGPIGFLEVEIAVEGSSYCGRFEAPPSTFKVNEPAKVIAKGPSSACVPATPTVTVTATVTATPTSTDTRTPTSTSTATRTASSTRTQTSTRTITPTPSQTLTETPTNTVPPGSTATSTGTETPTASPTATPFPPDPFRIDTIQLRDPHVYVEFGTCQDGTDPPGILMFFSVNGEVQKLLDMDDDMDGFLDLNLLALFRPLQQPPLAGGTLDISTGDCTPPVGSEICSPPEGGAAATAAYVNQTMGVCVSPLAGTTGPDNTGSYMPGITTPAAPCFSTVPVDIEFPFGLFTIPLQDVRAGATYVGGPANSLMSGMLTGFLSETDADNIIIEIPILGPRPVSSLLPGGNGACPMHDDKDLGPLGEPGWYFHLNFTAHRVTWTGQ